MASPFTAPAVPELRGIILRDESDKLVVQATEHDIRRFAPQRGQEVGVRPVDVRLRLGAQSRMMVPMAAMTTSSGPSPGEPGRIDPGDYLYDRLGRPVVMLTNVRIDADPLDIMTFGGTQQYIEGIRRVHVEGEGLPGVRVLG